MKYIFDDWRFSSHCVYEIKLQKQNHYSNIDIVACVNHNLLVIDNAENKHPKSKGTKQTSLSADTQIRNRFQIKTSI